MKLPELVKIDLHLHLDGSILPRTLWELAQEQGVATPTNTLEEYEAYIRQKSGCGSVNEYLEMFDLPVAVMQDAESLARVTRELVERLHDQKLDYAEIRFAPQLHTKQGLTQSKAVEAVLRGRQEGLARCPGFDVQILCCMMCIGTEQVNWEENMETVRVTKEFLGQGVAGLDLAGAEGIVPLSNFAPLFEQARAWNLPCTCHAGDSQHADTVNMALDFGVRRVGHGHHIAEDPAVLRRAIENHAAIEVCPTSNIQCRTQPSYREHPAKWLLDQGLMVTINTDNMTFAGVDLDAEYAHCLEDMGFEEEDLFQMSEHSIRAAFMSEERREMLLRKLEGLRAAWRKEQK